jgi:hypothetical protein
MLEHQTFFRPGIIPIIKKQCQKPCGNSSKKTHFLNKKKRLKCVMSIQWNYWLKSIIFITKDVNNVGWTYNKIIEESLTGQYHYVLTWDIELHQA